MNSYIFYKHFSNTAGWQVIVKKMVTGYIFTDVARKIWCDAYNMSCAEVIVSNQRYSQKKMEHQKDKMKMFEEKFTSLPDFTPRK